MKQVFHHSLFQWLPYYGSNTVPIDSVDPYAVRSGHAMGVVLGYDMRRKDLDYALLRERAHQWRQIVPCFYGDSYPLLPYSVEEEKWIAWQFHHAGRNEGVVQAFRRTKSDTATTTLHFGGLGPKASYRLNNVDTKAEVMVSGRELEEKALVVEIPKRPGAVVIHYRRST